MAADSMFVLHPNFSSTTCVGDLPLCRVLLSAEAEVPWLILVPRRPEVVLLIDLAAEEQLQLWRELALAQEALLGLPEVKHLNVAQIGNKTSQLHIHVIGRSPRDAIWPEPVWGHTKGLRRTEGEHLAVLHDLRASLGLPEAANKEQESGLVSATP